SGHLPGQFLDVAGPLPRVEALAPDPQFFPIGNLGKPCLQVVKREWPHSLAVMRVVPIVGHRGTMSSRRDHFPSRAATRTRRQIAAVPAVDVGDRSAWSQVAFTTAAWPRPCP